MANRQACKSDGLENRNPGIFARMFRGCMAGTRKKSAKTASVLVRVARPENVMIHEGELCIVDLSGRCTITCTEGTAWVTCPGRFCDYILHAGESLSLKGEGEAIVSGGADKLTVRISRS